eukprot:6360342-Amphidinium_carterae.2
MQANALGTTARDKMIRVIDSTLVFVPVLHQANVIENCTLTGWACTMAALSKCWKASVISAMSSIIYFLDWHELTGGQHFKR